MCEQQAETGNSHVQFIYTLQHYMHSEHRQGTRMYSTYTLTNITFTCVHGELIERVRTYGICILANKSNVKISGVTAHFLTTHKRPYVTNVHTYKYVLVTR